MLFHVTITHRPEDCPARRPGEAPELIGAEERRAALGDELSVTAHSVVWGASCILWAEPEHVAYALLEAASLDAVERYLAALTPASWATRPLPVFMMPSQLEVVRQVLAAPAIPSVPTSVSAPESPDDHRTEDALSGLLAPTGESAGQEPESPPPDEARVATLPPTVEPRDEPPDERLTRPTPQPVAAPPAAAPPAPPPPVATPGPDFGAVTRIIERPAILEGSAESATIILEPKSERPGLRLVASTGPSQGETFDVTEDGATLGRLPENSICLTDGRLSRHHARIEFRDGGYWLSDLGSQNGTLVNDHALSEAHLLQAGDTIELGTTRLMVMLEPDD